jgi:predicted nucleotidyltransferase
MLGDVDLVPWIDATPKQRSSAKVLSLEQARAALFGSNLRADADRHVLVEVAREISHGVAAERLSTAELINRISSAVATGCLLVVRAEIEDGISQRRICASCRAEAVGSRSRATANGFH